MQRSSQAAATGLLADYCGVFYEATFLLQLLANAPGDQRREEFDALMDVHAEGLQIHHELIGSLTEWPDRAADPWAMEACRLTAELHASFGRLVDISEALSDWDDTQMPDQVLQQCRFVERDGASLKHLWKQHDLAAVQRHLQDVRSDFQDVRSGLDTLDQALHAHQPVELSNWSTLKTAAVKDVAP